MEVPAALVQVLKELTEESQREDEVGRLARKWLSLLNGVEEKLREMLPAGPSRVSQRAKVQIVYSVESTAAGETLAERRLGGTAQPLRCPRAVYDVMVKVLANSEKPLSLDEITSAVEAAMGDRPADHQVRVPLRLWMHVQPPLVSRNRARYRATNSPTLVEVASHLWDQLRPQAS